ncbi:MAG: DDE-type integrase/transposase/recombinase [Acidobacteria bacterium]|nr:DDE-type integrase/transposase/recombinase [Acidobacteriota bacterium]
MSLPAQVGAEARYLTKEEVAQFEQQSCRWVERHALELGVVAGPSGANGKPEPRYNPHLMSPAAQERYLAARKEADELARRKALEASRAAADLTLSPRELEGQTLELGSDADRQMALHRYRAIAPLLRAVDGERTAVAKETAAAEGVGWRTLYRWTERYLGKYYEGRRGLEALVDRARADRGRSKKLNDAARELIAALLTPNYETDGHGRGALSVRQAHDEYEAERRLREALVGRIPDQFTAVRLARWIDADGRLSEDGRLPRICRRTLQEWAQQIPASYMELARVGPDSHDKKTLYVVSRDYDHLDPLEVVVMDHRKLDVFCILPPENGKGGLTIGRPWMTAAMDMRTRRWLAWTVGAHANSAGIASVVRRVVETFGRPANFYWDNGQDFDSPWMEAVCRDLGSNVIHAIPENARAKIIEPNFKRIAVAEPQLQTYVGNRSDRRPERVTEEARKWQRAYDRGLDRETIFRPMHEVAEVYDALLERLNETPCRGEGMLGRDEDGVYRQRTPMAIWSQTAANVTFEFLPDQQLQFLFMKSRQVTVRQAALSVQYLGKTVRYAAEGDPLRLTKLEQKPVEVRYDPHDLRRVAVFVDGIFWCMCRTATRQKFGEEDFKQDIAIRQRQARRDRETLAAVRRIPVTPPVDRLLAERKEPRVEPEVKRVTVIQPEVGRAALAAAGGSAPLRPIRTVRPEPEGGDDEFDWRLMSSRRERGDTE